MDTHDIIKHNLKNIFDKVTIACQKSNRDISEIKILGASKTVSPDIINIAHSYGINIFGENRVQEFLEKYQYVNNVEWHFIGRLQTNKIKYIYDKVSLIHSIDKIDQLIELEKRCDMGKCKSNILLEINISGEQSKGGISPDKIDIFIDQIIKLKNIFLKGFMTIPPFEENPENNRIYFKKMHEIFEKYKNLNYNNVNIEILSMGMSDDFDIAIEEGSNLIRIGTKLFGERKRE
ncbi:YggS family pyridoxal phosphate-dependent enzyme [Caldicellulosiruptoraceae bacterium PP1]